MSAFAMGHWSEVLSVQKTRKMLTFLDADDEAALWAILKGLLPDLLLVDGDRWPTPNPPLAAAPSGCSDSRMFLWSPDVAEIGDLAPCEVNSEIS